MFIDWLDQTFTITRTTTVTNPTTHIATKQTVTVGPYKCRISRQSTGTIIQTTPQAVATQTLRMYTLKDADVRVGDIALMDDGKKYILGIPYLAGKHHYEIDVTLKQEV